MEREKTARWAVVSAAALTSGLLVLPLVMAWLPGGRDVSLGAGASPPVSWGTFAASLAVAAAAASIAVVIGGLAAAILTLSDFPWPHVWGTALLLPFLAPPTAWAMAESSCYGPGGLAARLPGGAWLARIGALDPGHYAAAVLVLAQVHAPLAMLIVGRGLARSHHMGWDAARLVLRPAGRAGWLVGAARQELLAAWLVTFALALGNFAVPHVVQCRLYPIEIYLRLTNYLDQAGAWRAAAPLLAACVAAAGLAAWIERGTHYATATARRPALLRLGGWKWLAAGALMLYLALTTLLPLIALVGDCRSLSDFVASVRDAGPETVNTLWAALAAAGLAALAGALLAAAAGATWRRWAGILPLAVMGVPALLVGLACSKFYNRSWPVDLAFVGDTSALVVLGLALRAWPFAARLALDGRRRIAPAWSEAARLAGLGLPRRWWTISGPLVAGHLAAGATVAFVLAAGDVEICQMLCPPGGGTLALRLFTFLHFGPAHVAASLAALELAVGALPAALYLLVFNHRLDIV